ncbi:MAG: diacylglycerol kinase family lipid kinase [bacterium]
MTASDVMPEKIFFIINAFAGSRGNERLRERIKESLDPQRWEPVFRDTEYAGHAALLSKEAIQQGYRFIVAVGGDGTINEVAGPMIHGKSTLAIIPTGSGNGLARHLKIPLTIPKAVALINHLRYRIIDTATMNDTKFCSLAGIGFDALVAHHFAESKRRGYFTYFSITLRHFLTFKPKKYSLIVDGEKEIETEAFLIVFANSNQFGYNTQIAPKASLIDGKLDICIVKRPPWYAIPSTVKLLMTNKIDQSPYVRIIRCSQAEVIREKDEVVNLDGEPVMMTQNLKVKNWPKSLKIIAPLHE